MEVIQGAGWSMEVKNLNAYYFTCHCLIQAPDATVACDEAPGGPWLLMLCQEWRDGTIRGAAAEP